MKPKRIIYLEKILRFMAKAVLWRHKPVIVGITGSVGKTSTKEAVFSVLSSKFSVRKNEKNYNNEIGLPLTIIGAESGKKSALKWMLVFFKWLGVIILPIKYPKILVLEMGVDRPEDMTYLLSFVKPKIGIMTNVFESHLEFFKSIDHIAREKGKLIFSLPEDGLAILNCDNDKIVALKEKVKIPSMCFGLNSNSEIKASDINYIYDNLGPQGISFKLNYKGKIIPFRLPKILAPHLIYASLIAIAVGIYFKINLIEIAEALENFSSPAGRMNLIRGMKGSFIIDDTYNSSPASAGAALDVLKDLRAIRKIAVLGDMLELGENSEREHEEIIKKSFEKGAVIFLGVGKRMQEAAENLISREEISGRIMLFSDPESAGLKLRETLREGDLVLVKGSQGMRMEKIASAVMQNHQEAEKLLCRQSKDWLKKPYIKP